MNLKEENEKLRKALKHLVAVTTPDVNGQIGAVEEHLAALHNAEAVLSQQAEPTSAQDEREAAIELTRKVHRALRLSDSYLNVRDAGDGFQRFKYDDTQAAFEVILEALATRPAQKVNNVDRPEQQPARLPDEVMVLLTHIEDVLPDDGWDLIEAGKWNAVTRLAAPIAQQVNKI